MEIERKWLFDLSKIPKDLECINEYEYDQGYLNVNSKNEVRIRRKRKVGTHNYGYVLCIKSKGLLERIEIQKQITEEEFYQLMQAGGFTEDDLIHKRCSHYYVDDYNVLAVGVSDIGKPTEFYYGEIEFSSVEDANEFKPPKWFGKEVTHDSDYKMANYWQRTRIDNDWHPWPER